MPAAQSYVRRTHAVWELTLRCNLACLHCGSRADSARPDELSTAEALDLVRQLAEVGIGEVSLIGGEAFLRPDWMEIARAVTDAGMIATLTTGGLGLGKTMAARVRDAGIRSVSVSLDGLEASHDYQRGRKGSWQHAIAAIGHLREAGVEVGANSQINRLSAPEFPRLYEVLRDAGAFAWQIQFTVPMGNAADNHRILLQPVELLDVFPMLALIASRAERDGLIVQSGNNVGYYGPYERLLRGARLKDRNFWQGCAAGAQVLGIEADGAIKGCPSLPTAAYVGGNVRERPLSEIIRAAEALNFNMNAGTDAALEAMWGFCRGCEFARLCRGGCAWTQHVFFDRRGNNPYCHHRALSLARQGRRERLRLVRPAEGRPFDNGRFELIEEPLNAPWPADDELRFTRAKIQWPDGWTVEPQAIERLPRMVEPAEGAPGFLVGALPAADVEGVLLPRGGWNNRWGLTGALADAESALAEAEAAAEPLHWFRDIG